MSAVKFPGYLYAKSLLRNGAKTDGYALMFVHERIKRYEQEIRDLQNSFEWAVSANTRFSSVVAYRRVEDAVLVVRFFDEGEDSFKRPHTLRVEGVLAGMDNFNVALNCVEGCRVLASEAMYEFQYSTRLDSGGIPGPGWKFIGDEKSFSCNPIGRKVETGNATRKDFSSEESRMEQSFARRSGNSLVLILAALLIVLVGLVISQYSQSVGQASEIRRLRAELRTSDERVKQLQEWVGDRETFERNRTHVKRIFSDLKKEITKAELLLQNIDGRKDASSEGTIERTQDQKEAK